MCLYSSWTKLSWKTLQALCYKVLFCLPNSINCRSDQKSLERSSIEARAKLCTWERKQQSKHAARSSWLGSCTAETKSWWYHGSKPGNLICCYCRKTKKKTTTQPKPTPNSNITPKTSYGRKGDKSFFSLVPAKPQLKKHDRCILRCFNTSLSEWQHREGKAEQQPSVFVLLHSLDPVQIALGMCLGQTPSFHTHPHLMAASWVILMRYILGMPCAFAWQRNKFTFLPALSKLSSCSPSLIKLLCRFATQNSIFRLLRTALTHYMFISAIFQLSFLQREVSTLGPNSPTSFISACPSHLLKFKHPITLSTDKNSCTFRSLPSSPAPPIFAGDNKNLTGSTTTSKPYLSQCAWALQSSVKCWAQF